MDLDRNVKTQNAGKILILISFTKNHIIVTIQVKQPNIILQQYRPNNMIPNGIGK